MVITDFLKTAKDKSELRVALDVLREFKGCESREERAFTPGLAWSKLEQMEEFLAHLVDGAPLAYDTLSHIAAANGQQVLR